MKNKWVIILLVCSFLSCAGFRAEPEQPTLAVVPLTESASMEVIYVRSGLKEYIGFLAPGFNDRISIVKVRFSMQTSDASINEKVAAMQLQLVNRNGKKILVPVLVMDTSFVSYESPKAIARSGYAGNKREATFYFVAASAYKPEALTVDGVTMVGIPSGE